MNKREIKAALCARVAVATRRMMNDPRKARSVVHELGLKDTVAVRKRILAACDELEERWT